MFVFLTSICAIIVGGLVFVLLYFVKMTKYWPKRGFHFVSYSEIGGSFLNVLKGSTMENGRNADKKLYQLMKEKSLPIAGYLEFASPTLITGDMDLIRSIYVKDSDHFVNRRDFNAKLIFPMADKMMLFAEGEEWKDLRTKMSPTFTTGKIRRMFEIIDTCGQRLVEYLNVEVKKSNGTLNLAEGYGKFTLDIISTAAFGIESRAFQEKETIFEKMAEHLQLSLKLKNTLKIMAVMVTPKLAEFFNITMFPRDCEDFFKGTIKNAINHRKQSGEKREDFLQLMLEAQAGQLKMDTAELNTFEKEAQLSLANKEKDKTRYQLTDEVICAQSILFFIAGFDTTQSLLHFAAHSLAVETDVQTKLVQEVSESWKENGGKFTYDSINQMEYMDKVVSETLRMYPPAIKLERRCTKDYKIPGTDLVVKSGELVGIPVLAIHHDEDIYPSPEKFDPERFSKESKAARSPYAYMPFGHGPRNCIGMRFALTEVKTALAHLLLNFELEPCEKTPIPMKFASTTTLKPEGGIWLKMTRRKDNEQ